MRLFGEWVVIIKQGKPFVELVPAWGVGGMSEERAAGARRELGLDGLTVRLSPEFDDPRFSLGGAGAARLRLLLDMPMAIWAALDPLSLIAERTLFGDVAACAISDVIQPCRRAEKRSAFRRN